MGRWWSVSRPTTRTLIAALALACALPSTARAVDVPLPPQRSTPITAHLNVAPDGSCPTYGDLQICSGQVPSFDGAPLDVDLTLPPGAKLRSGPPDGDHHPLMVAIHGAGGTDTNKYELQSTTDEANNADRWHWNSHWFAKHGYYVLTLTQRGYRNEGQAFDWQPRTPAGTSVSFPNGTIRLTSREFSPRDEQWVAAQVARSFDVDTNRVAVTGRLSGGGETWQLATEPRWTFAHAIDPELPVLRLRAAIPRGTWTDLAYVFAPHGHGGGPRGTDLYESSYGRAGSERPLPGLVGTPKLSFLAAVYAVVANRQGVLESGFGTTPSEEGPVNLHAWFHRAMAGDPDVGDPILEQARQGLTHFRSTYFLPDRWSAQSRAERVPILAMQSWTDDLFTAVEAFRQFKYLKRLSANWPIRVLLGDFGNARAQNPPPVWRKLNAEGWRFLTRNLRDGATAASRKRKRAEPAITSYPTRCAADVLEAPPGKPLTAASPERLGRGKLTVHYRTGAVTTSASGIQDPEGPLTEPTVGSRLNRCIVATDAGTPRYSLVSDPLPGDATYVGLGHVTVPYRLQGGLAGLHVRLWDVPPPGTPAPDEKTRLVTRGTYTLVAPRHDAPAGTIRIPLFGNHWALRRGHRLRLDVAQVEQPFFRPFNTPSTIKIEPPALSLPLAERVRHRLGGS